MNTRDFDTEAIATLIDGDDGIQTPTVGPDGSTVGWLMRVRCQYAGEWRWGSRYTLVFQERDAADKSDLGFWAFDYEESSGDSEWCWQDEADETVECYRVKPVPVNDVKFVKVDGNE